MGIVHSFDQLDPTVLERALAFVGTRDNIPLPEIRALLAELGRDQPQRFHENTDWPAVEELLEGVGGNERWLIVRACASKQTWCVDKAFDRPAGGFAELFAREPSLAPVAQLFRSGDRPQQCKHAEELLQIVSPPNVVVIRDAVQPWLDDTARDRIAQLKPSLFGRVFGPRDFATEWHDDASAYLWNHWRSLGEAVSTCANAGTPLAVTWG